jgi:hypothetical protein
MRCDECQALIEVYFDGELAEGSAARIAEHVAACDSCAGAFDMLERERDFYLKQEFDVDVSPDFWPGVFAKAQIGRQARSGRGKPSFKEAIARTLGGLFSLKIGPAAVTALLILSVGVTIGLMEYLHSREKGDDSATVTPGARDKVAPSAKRGVEGTSKRDGASQAGASHGLNSAGGSQNQPPGPGALTQSGSKRHRPNVRRGQGPEELVREAEQKYLAAIALLAKDANRRRPHLDHVAQAQFEQTLTAIDRAIAGTRRAVREHPGDPLAAQYMLAAYAKKVDVLRQMVSDE